MTTTLSRLPFSGAINVPIDFSTHVNVKSSMCTERTKHLWYKYYGLFVRMYITSQPSYLSHILTRGKQVSKHVLIESVNHVTVVRHNP